MLKISFKDNSESLENISKKLRNNIPSIFARISENNITVLSHDVTTFEGLDKEQAEEMLSEAKSHVAGGAYFTAQTGQKVDLQKAKFIVKMAEMAVVQP